MKKLTILVIILISFQFTASSQTCLPEGITFSTQAQIDNFPYNYPGCTEIEGYVVILGDEINNLSFRDAGEHDRFGVCDKLRIGDFAFRIDADQN